MPELPDLEVEAEGHNTWCIENYRALAKREHGPVFQCGGFPWCVIMRCLTSNRTDHTTGEYSSFHMATMLTMRRSTWSRGLKTSRPRAGMPVSSLHWSYGTRMIHQYIPISVTYPSPVIWSYKLPANLCIQLPSIGSMQTKVIGASPDLRSSGKCSPRHGKTEGDLW